MPAQQPITKGNVVRAFVEDVVMLSNELEARRAFDDLIARWFASQPDASAAFREFQDAARAAAEPAMPKRRARR